MTHPDPRIAELTSLLGPSGVVADDDTASYLIDERKVFVGSAIAVVRPASTAEVAAVMSWCSANKIAVVSQGGNSGLSGGATPERNGDSIVLSLRRMNTIESVDVARSTMTVQAGVIVEAAQQAAAEYDRLFAPDWGARGSATVGGAIATDAGGNNVLRYGNMRDNVMGLEVVLPDGRIWNGLRALRKDSSGYDLKQLFIGSEGTLGVITRAVLKLRPATPYVQSAFAALTSLDALLDLYSVASEVAGDIVTALELVPEVGLARVCEVYGTPRPIGTNAEFYALIKLADRAPVTDTLAAVLETAAERGLITDAVIAASGAQEQQLWMIRDELPPTRIYPHHGAGMKLDTAVPLDRITDFYTGVSAIAAEVSPKALCYGFGHVGDGNMHMMILPLNDADLAEFASLKPQLMNRIDELTFAMNGTLSAEHGVGVELRDRVRGQKPDIEWELMATIKAALDPQGLMNPGKLLPR
jgi:FAD/FMN-containing dehydrogenase